MAGFLLTVTFGIIYSGVRHLFEGLAGIAFGIILLVLGFFGSSSLSSVGLIGGAVTK